MDFSSLTSSLILLVLLIDFVQAVDQKKETEEVDLPIQVLPIFERRLYKQYGQDYNDLKLHVPNLVDYHREPLQLKNPITFMGHQYGTVYILDSGGIGFNGTNFKYRKDILDMDATLIIPYWVRNDIKAGGNVYYREVNRGDLGKKVLSRGKEEIAYHFGIDAEVKSAIIVTWDGMGPHLKNRSDVFPKDKLNRVQAVILNTDEGTFANFIYHNIGWGKYAKAGFMSGRGKSIVYTLPHMGTNYPMVHGNTGVPGEWMFMINKMDQIIYCKEGYTGTKCDKRCEAGSYGFDCLQPCSCGERLCHKKTGRCLTIEEEDEEKPKWLKELEAQGHIIAQRRRRRRSAELYPIV